MQTKMITGYRCERCGHEWVPREKTHDPRVCPKCKSPYWKKAYRELDLEKNGPVGIITLDRPEKKNAFSDNLARELYMALARLDADNEINVVVITGNEEAFSSGAEMGELLKSSVPDFVADVRKVVETVAALEKPVIAAVSGWCLAGGLELALAADIRIASETAKFGDWHVKVGSIGGAGVTARLPRVVGLAKAKEIILSGATVSAGDALRIGLVNAVYPTEAYLQEALAMAQRMASFPLHALRMNKRALDRGMDMNAFQAIRYNQECSDFSLNSPNSLAAVEAIMKTRNEAQEERLLRSAGFAISPPQEGGLDVI